MAPDYLDFAIAITLVRPVQKVKDTAQKVRGLEVSYAAKFPDKDMQDILSLVVMDIAMAQA